MSLALATGCDASSDAYIPVDACRLDHGAGGADSDGSQRTESLAMAASFHPVARALYVHATRGAAATGQAPPPDLGRSAAREALEAAMNLITLLHTDSDTAARAALFDKFEALHVQASAAA